MDTKTAQSFYPAGIRMLRLFYLVGAIFYAASIILFYNYIEVALFGFPAGRMWSNIVNLILAGIPLYFYIDLHGPNRRVLYAIYVYQVTFMLNSAVSICKLSNERFPLTPMIQIVERTDLSITKIQSASLYPQITLHALSIVVGMVIIAYLLRKKNLFAP